MRCPYSGQCCLALSAVAEYSSLPTASSTAHLQCHVYEHMHACQHLLLMPILWCDCLMYHHMPAANVAEAVLLHTAYYVHCCPACRGPTTQALHEQWYRTTGTTRIPAWQRRVAGPRGPRQSSALLVLVPVVLCQACPGPQLQVTLRSMVAGRPSATPLR
jgi:hypothetical protein